MRSAPKESMPIVMKHDTENKQVMYINSIDEKNDTVEAVWVSDKGTPYKATFKTDMVEKYNPSKSKKE